MANDQNNRLIVIKQGYREFALLWALARAVDDHDQAGSITDADIASAEGTKILKKLTVDDAYIEGSKPTVTEFLSDAYGKINNLNFFRHDPSYDFARKHFHWQSALTAYEPHADNRNYFSGRSPLPLILEIGDGGQIVDLGFLPSYNYQKDPWALYVQVTIRKNTLLARRFAKQKDDLIMHLPWHSWEKDSLNFDKSEACFDWENFAALYRRNPKSVAVLFGGVAKVPGGSPLIKHLYALTRLGYSLKGQAQWVEEYQNGGLAALFILSTLLLDSQALHGSDRRAVEEIARRVGECGRESALPPLEVAEQTAQLFLSNDKEKSAAILELCRQSSFDPILTLQVVRSCLEASGEGEPVGLAAVSSAMKKPEGVFGQIKFFQEAGWSEREIYDTFKGLAIRTDKGFVPCMDYSLTKNSSVSEQEKKILQLLSEPEGPPIIRVVASYRETGPYVMTFIEKTVHNAYFREDQTTEGSLNNYARQIDDFIIYLRNNHVPEPLIEELFYFLIDVWIPADWHLLGKSGWRIGSPSRFELENHTIWALHDSVLTRIENTTDLKREDVTLRIDGLIQKLFEAKAP